MHSTFLCVNAQRANLPGYTWLSHRKVLFLLSWQTEKVKGTINTLVGERGNSPSALEFASAPVWELHLWAYKVRLYKVWGTGIYSGLDQGENLRWQAYWGYSGGGDLELDQAVRFVTYHWNCRLGKGDIISQLII